MVCAQISGGQIITAKHIGTKKGLSDSIPLSSLLGLIGIHLKFDESAIIKIEVIEKGSDADMYEKFKVLSKKE